MSEHGEIATSFPPTTRAPCALILPPRRSSPAPIPSCILSRRTAACTRCNFSHRVKSSMIGAQQIGGEPLRFEKAADRLAVNWAFLHSGCNTTVGHPRVHVLDKSGAFLPRNRAFDAKACSPCRAEQWRDRRNVATDPLEVVRPLRGAAQNATTCVVGPRKPADPKRSNISVR